jgi:hypothetical protein
VKMNTNVIQIMGTVRCPGGKDGKRREIYIPKESTASLPIARFPITRGNPATDIKLIKYDDIYNTGLRRYEQASYITGGFPIMRYNLIDFLQRYGLHRCGTDIPMKVQGNNFVI